MARVLVQVDSEEEYRFISQALSKAGHEIVSAVDESAGGDESVLSARGIIAGKVELAIMDYLPEDAVSVKVMQQVRGEAPFTGFLFIMPPDAEREHMILALNEGASALLARPVREMALLNYVNRTLANQKEAAARWEEVERCQSIIEKEKSCVLDQAESISEQKRLLRSLFRLVDGLLAGLPDKNRKVLVVSDSGYQLDMFKRHLEDRRFQVITAMDGEKGLETAKAEKPKIIVSDLEMPGMTGLEFCRAVKNLESLAPNYFIICTANEDKIKTVMSPEYKVDDCLIKPSAAEDFQEFAARVALGLLA